VAVFSFDESLGEQWTISDDRAAELSPAVPERRTLGHLTLLANEVLNAQSRRLENSWTDAELRKTDVLVIADPIRRATPTVVSCLERFVRCGGALLVIAGSLASPDAASSVSGRFGIRVNGRTVVSTRTGEHHLVSDAINCRTIRGFLAEHHVREVVCQHGRSLACERESQASVVAPTGETVFAAVLWGRGRVAVLGSSELVAVPYIGLADNALLYAVTLAWLAGERDGEAASRRRAEATRALLLESPYSPMRPEVEAVGDSAVPVVDLSDVHRHLLDGYPDGLSPYADATDFLERAASCYLDLPARIRRKLAAFRDHSNGVGALLISGLPADPALPLTPASPTARPFRETYLSEFWLAVFSNAVGTQVGYSQESNGALFCNVLPTPWNSSKLSSESSETALDPHTEMAFHPAMPDHLLLYCLRSAPDASTMVVGVRELVRLVPIGHRPALFRRAFRTGIDYSFGSPNGMVGNGPLSAILEGDPYDPLLRLDPDLMVALDEESDAALTAIGHAMKSCTRYVTLAASNLLLIDNRRAVHGRSRFKASFDGRDRWLQRSYTVRDVNRHAAELGGSDRVFSTAFAI